MYHLLIVDSEKFVFTKVDQWTRKIPIVQIIDWESLGITRVSYAQDGAIGLKLARKHKPDIIMTEVNLPFIGGLSMCEHILRELPNTKIVVVTANTQIEHAIHAIQLKVCDYMIKPITPKQVMTAFGHVVDALNDRNQYTTLCSCESMAQVCREQLLCAIITDPLVDIGYEKKIRLVQQILPYAQYTVYVQQLKTDDLCSASKLKKLNALYKERLTNQVGDYGTVFCNNDQFVTIFNDIQMSGDHFCKEYSKSFIDFIEKFSNKQRCYIHTGSGMSVNHVKQLGQSYQAACKALKYNIVASRNTLFDYAEINKQPDFVLPELLVQQFIASVYAHKDCYALLDELVEKLTSFKRLTADNLRFICFKFVLVMSDMANKNPQFQDFDLYDIFSDINKINNIHDFQNMIYRYITNIREIIHLKTYNQQQFLVKQAQSYIQKNYYDCNLTLHTVALNLHITYGYLSSIFRQESGCSFVDYVSSLRIDKAKALFYNQSLNNKQIAQSVGYKDPKYFAICFKKYTGMTPFEYRKQMIESLPQSNDSDKLESE